MARQETFLSVANRALQKKAMAFLVVLGVFCQLFSPILLVNGAVLGSAAGGLRGSKFVAKHEFLAFKAHQLAGVKTSMTTAIRLSLHGIIQNAGEFGASLLKATENNISGVKEDNPQAPGVDATVAFVQDVKAFLNDTGAKWMTHAKENWQLTNLSESVSSESGSATSPPNLTEEQLAALKSYIKCTASQSMLTSLSEVYDVFAAEMMTFFTSMRNGDISKKTIEMFGNMKSLEEMQRTRLLKDFGEVVSVPKQDLNKPQNNSSGQTDGAVKNDQLAELKNSATTGIKQGLHWVLNFVFQKGVNKNAVSIRQMQANKKDRPDLEAAIEAMEGYAKDMKIIVTKLQEEWTKYAETKWGVTSSPDFGACEYGSTTELDLTAEQFAALKVQLAEAIKQGVETSIPEAGREMYGTLIEWQPKIVDVEVERKRLALMAPHQNELFKLLQPKTPTLEQQIRGVVVAS